MMRTIIWVVLLSLALVYGVFAYITIDRRTDEAKISALIDDTAAAVQRQDFSGAIAGVSANYKDDSLNYDRLRMLVASALNDAPKFTLRSAQGPIALDGDNATVAVQAKVLGSQGGAILYERSLTVHLQRETGRHMLLIPVKVWRVIRVDNLELATM